MSRDHYPVVGLRKRQGHRVVPDDVAPGLRRRRQVRKSCLTLEEKLDIAHRVIVCREAQKELAQEYRVSQLVVSVLVGKVRKKPSLLAELLSERESKRDLE